MLKKFLSNKRMVAALLFAMFGLCTEIVFTSLSAWQNNFIGQVSVLMAPVYALSYLLLSSGVGQWMQIKWPNILVRSLMVVGVIYLVEYVSGNFFFFIGLEPWRYHHGWASDFSNGSITLYYLPFWYGFAFIVVRAGDIITEIAPLVDDLIHRESQDLVVDIREAVAEFKNRK